MKPTKIIPPHVLALKRRYRQALRNLRAAVSDFSPGADDRFRAMKRKADLLYQTIYFSDTAYVTESRDE